MADERALRAVDEFEFAERAVQPGVLLFRRPQFTVQFGAGGEERDERGGLPPEAIARTAVRLANSKNPPVKASGGKKYALFLFLAKILPSRLVSYIIGKMYA